MTGIKRDDTGTWWAETSMGWTSIPNIKKELERKRFTLPDQEDKFLSGQRSYDRQLVEQYFAMILFNDTYPSYK